MAEQKENLDGLLQASNEAKTEKSGSISKNQNNNSSTYQQSIPTHHEQCFSTIKYLGKNKHKYTEEEGGKLPQHKQTRKKPFKREPFSKAASKNPSDSGASTSAVKENHIKEEGDKWPQHKQTRKQPFKREPFSKAASKNPSDSGASTSAVKKNHTKEKYNHKNDKSCDMVQSSDTQNQKCSKNKFLPKQTEHVSSQNKKMSYKQLENVLNKEPSFVITSLANPKSGFKELASNHPIRPDLLLLIFQVLSKIVDSELHQLKMKVLSETMTPEMIDEIKIYSQRLCIENDQNLLKSVESFFRDTLKVIEASINYFPSLMNEKLKSVMLALNLSMKNAKIDQDISISKGLFDALKDITEQVSVNIELNRLNQEKSKNTNLKESKAPNNFRDMAIVPTKEDFTCQKAYLRKNIIQGSYRDCEEYLDVQFRLLREDFIDPLRTGIFEYIESINIPHSKRKFSNVRIYPKVKFMASSRDKLGFLINFDLGKKIPKNINWEFNKRFTVGSLLLLSQNDFKKFFLATIIDRNIRQLHRSILTIAFVPGTETPEQIFGENIFFVMAESEVYYEAYRPVLSALQRMTEHSFPMKKYIVDVITDSTPPNHLSTKSNYTVGNYKFDILNESTWPSKEQMKLNSFQLKAFKTALSNEFAVIQGPPGTGKTFLALKITEVLLKNEVSKNTPIVVICYTNHALDQFLEGILKQTTNLIRIGSRSQNEVLEKYNIDVMRKGKKERRDFDVSDLCKRTVAEKYDLRQKLDSVKKKVDELSFPKGILHLNSLKSIIPPFQYDDLVNHLVDWLFFEDNPYWFDEEVQVPNSIEDNLVFSSNLDSQDIDEQTYEDEEESEENKRRLADLMEDDFLFDEDIKMRKTFMSNLTYSFYLFDAEQVLIELRNELVHCESSFQNNVQCVDLFHYAQMLKEQIQHITWKVEHFNNESQKFVEQFQLNAENLVKLQAITSVWDIDPSMRWDYYWTWVHLYRCQLNQTIHYLTNRYQDVGLQLNELRQLDDLQFVRKANVIGLTTSGAAKRRVLLENLGTKIVIVEEAAEVLEAHIVTALAPSVQHVILIGDHKQLKPNPAVYRLAKKFNMDISLFERMLNNGLGCSVLGVQHRMRPEIASLITPTVYSDLDSHPTTYDRQKISGIDKFVFFLKHNHPEDQLPDSTSRQNKFEADFLIELCQYLLRNGYQPQDITILATYIGQVWYLRKARLRLSSGNPDWKLVRITPVDNFQGEESKIILLSLVRSNKENRIGFLSTENRVCVALSRARDGLYIVGNMDNLVASSAIWPKVQDQLQQINAIGDGLTLRCERHPEQITVVSSAKDISAIPNGGCSLMCQFKLSCGHVCPQVCHIIDKEHGFYQCLERCNRRPCDVLDHKCPLPCFKPCEPCKIKVDKLLPCGHTKLLPCHQEPASANCMEIIPTKHPDCDHTIEKPCFLDITSCRCLEKCPFRLPCGHACERKCHVKIDYDHIEYKCMKDCVKPNLKCRRNHKCRKPCFQDCGECVVPVRAELACGHNQLVECNVDESSIVCKKRCKKTLTCGHKCRLQCSSPCSLSLCKEKVDKEGSCGHIFKNMTCNESTDSKRCYSNCNRTLACGHPCKEKCFKDCSQVLCQVLVESKVAPACGHPPINIPCHLNKSDLKPGCDELLRLCKAKCEAQLACGHVCEGSCGGCMTGRLHQQCQQRCTKRLICGHMCSSKCGKLCPPCYAKECFSHCAHHRCASVRGGKKSHCSTSCQPCSRKCVWACEHQQCTKPCGEVCNRSVCDEPCSLPLQCGHPCIGYCGEVCPPLCRICHLDNEIFTSSPPHARFVLLEDCNHLIESSLLREMISCTQKPVVGALLLCPLCSHPIVKTMRCRDIYIRFREKSKPIQNLIKNELERFMKKYLQFERLVKQEPTCSALMNNLLQDCYNKYRGSTFNRVMIISLLRPLVAKCFYLKRHEKDERLRLRLEYLALCLRPRLGLEDISIEDIVQVELEITRTLRLLFDSSNHYQDWYDSKPFTWEQDMIIRERIGMSLPTRVSPNLKTRDFKNKWFECKRQHLYVGNVEDPCHVCKELSEEQAEALQQRKQRPLQQQISTGPVVNPNHINTPNMRQPNQVRYRSSRF